MVTHAEFLNVVTMLSWAMTDQDNQGVAAYPNAPSTDYKVIDFVRINSPNCIVLRRMRIPKSTSMWFTRYWPYGGVFGGTIKVDCLPTQRGGPIVVYIMEIWDGEWRPDGWEIFKLSFLGLFFPFKLKEANKMEFIYLKQEKHKCKGILPQFHITIEVCSFIGYQTQCSDEQVHFKGVQHFGKGMLYLHTSEGNGYFSNYELY